jgi:hypothetical protein
MWSKVQVVRKNLFPIVYEIQRKSRRTAKIVYDSRMSRNSVVIGRVRVNIKNMHDVTTNDEQDSPSSPKLTMCVSLSSRFPTPITLIRPFKAKKNGVHAYISTPASHHP